MRKSASGPTSATRVVSGADEKVILERADFRVVAVRRPDDEPRTGLEWGWAMVNCIATGETWHDVYDAQEDGRVVRLAPAIDRIELLEMLAERAPDDDAVSFLGADEWSRPLSAANASATRLRARGSTATCRRRTLRA